MIAIKHFRELIVRPALDKLQLYSIDREELLVITCAQESLGGTYLMQNDAQGYPKGPALGIFQMEPATYHDLFENYLRYQVYLHHRLVSVIDSPVIHIPSTDLLVRDSRFAAACACLQYYRFPEPIPSTLEGQLRYYKTYWNTARGRATIPETRRNYERFLAGG